MKTNQCSNLIVICGPTGSGKSEVANLLATHINGEVVSADSMQIYKGMNIGTGKFMPAQQSVQHWGIDIVQPVEAYSAALFQKYSRKCFNDIWSRGKNAVLCGGTGFYIRAAIDDYNFPDGEQSNNPIREKYQDFLTENGPEQLWNLLNCKDPKSATQIHPNNSVRVIRALELLEEGKSYADQLSNYADIKQKYDCKMYALDVDRPILYERINKRVDKMFDDGLIKEVTYLLNKDYKNALTAAGAIGYKEIVAYLEGNYSLEDAKEQIKQSSRRYAKRQLTWFRKDKRITWIKYNTPNPQKAVDVILENLN